MPSKNSRKRRRRKQKTNYIKLISMIALLAVVTIVVGYVLINSGGDDSISDEDVIDLTRMKVLFKTSMGDITIQLRDDMPITTTNFKNLVYDGTYDGTFFHRVVNLPENLVMIQGGDPTGTGYGDPSIPNIEDEFSDNTENNKNEIGTIAMANTGEANSGSSQFFINGEYNDHLDNKHPVFGDVIDGMDIVNDILNVETNENAKPLKQITIIRATLID